MAINEENDTVMHDFSYNDNCIVEKIHNKYKSDSINYNLNANKKIEKTYTNKSFIEQPELILYNIIISKKTKSYEDFIVKYNDKGYIDNIKMIGVEDSLDLFFEYKNDNILKIKLLYNSEYFAEENYEYYSNYNNTIGKENLYGNFIGKQNKNLVKKITTTYNNNNNTETYEYEYTFDSFKRVKTEKVITKGDNQIYRTSLRTFEYF